MKTKEEIEKEIQDVEEMRLHHMSLARLDTTNVLARELEKKYTNVKSTLEWVLGEDRENNKNNEINVAFTEYTNSRDLGWYSDIMREEACQAYVAAWKRSRELLAEDRAELAEEERKVFKLRPKDQASSAPICPIYSIAHIKDAAGYKKFELINKWWNNALGEGYTKTIAFNAFYRGYLAAEDQENKKKDVDDKGD